MSGNGFVVVVALQPKPLSSLHLDRRFTRIDYTPRCTMLNVLEGMARILKVDQADLRLETEGGADVILEQALAEYEEKNSRKPCSSLGERKSHHQRWPRYVKRQRREINLIVRHIPSPQKVVTCTVEGGEHGHELRRTAVQLPNTATFGELLVRARDLRYGALEFEGPIYGKRGELDTTLKDAWVRDGCKVDGTLHIGLAVVVSFPGLSRKPLHLVMGPSDTVGDVKKRVSSHQGVAPSRQSVTVRGETQKLEESVPLKDFCPARVAVVGRSVPAVPVEIHLELVVKEIAFPSLSLSKAVLGGGGDSSTPRPLSHSNFFDTGNKEPLVAQETINSLFLPPPPPPPPTTTLPPGVAPKPNTHHVHGAINPFLATSSSLSSPPSSSLIGRVTSNPTQGYGCYVVALFALSPSGRALALRVPGAGTVLHAKEQVAAFEGVPTCQQRLLWRGKPLEPDHAHLYKFGIRSGDTLVVGYRFPRAALGVPTPIEEDDTEIVSNGMVGSEEKVADPCEESECVIHHLRDRFFTQEHDVPEIVMGDVDGHNDAAKKKNESANLIYSADARTTNGGLDIAVGDGGSDGSDGSGGGGGGGGSSGGSNVLQGHDKSSGRRLWWSKKARNTRNNVNRHERYGVNEGGVGRAAAVASFSGSTHTHSGASPAPLQQARDTVGGGSGRVNALPRDTEPSSAPPGYVLASSRRTRQPPAPLAVRTPFSLFVRRKHGRRMPTSSASSAEDADNAE